jgi:hypothetical protein
MADNVLEINTSDFNKQVSKLAIAYPQIAHALMQTLVLAIVEMAKEQTPVGKTGLLKANIQWEADGHCSFIIFDPQEYAAIQHERLDYHHDVGKAHYISDPIATIGVGQMPQVIAANLLNMINSNLGGV